LKQLRNIGISAHIDSGKTTLTERILFYCDKIHAIHEVRGKDGVGATMDSMELEKERGITIASAATYVEWKNMPINIIDTPGHVDFTIEVERALRVLDGAILVLSGVEGVQSQSITVDRQMRRYNVPRLAFINKLDRTGSDPFRVTKQLREKLSHNAILMQIPIGLEDQHIGIIDLIDMKAYIFEGDNGENILVQDIPANLKEQADEYRDIMLEGLSLFNDELAEKYLEGQEIERDLLDATVRKACISLELTPVFMGSAYKNKGVQKLLDAVLAYLPNPEEVENKALDLDNEEKEIILNSDNIAPPIALAFKLEDGQYGQLTYLRIYQGTITKGTELVNIRSKKKFKVGRLVKMHSNHMEDIESSEAGEIAALFGVDCASGDTFCTPKLNYSMTSMHVPEPVISLSIKPLDKKSENNMGKAISRFTKEDPTFRCYVDKESNETIVQGMGELHLDVYIERMKREYNVQVETGAPQVAYRETISKKAEFDYTHKKQSGGAGQFGRVSGFVEPTTEEDFIFVNKIKGGVIPGEYIPSCEKGFKAYLKRGPQIGFPIVGVKVTINDGTTHAVDSSDIAFQMAGIGSLKQVENELGFEIMEPVMKVVVEGPTEFQGNILSSINQRRGVILSTSEENNFTAVESEVPLSEMFGYSTSLRSLTQGKAEFTMEFLKYGKVPNNITEELKRTIQKNERR